LRLLRRARWWRDRQSNRSGADVERRLWHEVLLRPVVRVAPGPARPSAEPRAARNFQGRQQPCCDARLLHLPALFGVRMTMTQTNMHALLPLWLALLVPTA